MDQIEPKQDHKSVMKATKEKVNLPINDVKIFISFL